MCRPRPRSAVVRSAHDPPSRADGGRITSSLPTNPETVFTHGTRNLKFGPGAANEIGSNPIADMWSEKSLKLLARSCRTAVLDGDDVGARMKQQQLATAPRLVTEDDAAGIFTRSITLC